MTDEEFAQKMHDIPHYWVALMVAYQTDDMTAMVKYANDLANAAMSLESMIDRLRRQVGEQQHQLYERLQNGKRPG